MEQMIAFPDGIPGGWDSERKVHFLGHSMGAQTVRYMQYLLSIDYFEQKQYFTRGIFTKKPRRIDFSYHTCNYDYAIKEKE